MLGSIQESTACELSASAREVAATCDRIVRERIPNLFRLYLNPYVAQACYCLTQLVEGTWPATNAGETYQVFLANSMEEALSGAIKLARCSANDCGRPTDGLIIDDDDRLKHFASTDLSERGTVTYIPGVNVWSETAPAPELPQDRPMGFLVAFLSSLRKANSTSRRILREICAESNRPWLIVCADRDGLTRVERREAARIFEFSPDIIVFDETFTNRSVPFGAFAATKKLYERWNRRNMATFHSTTYQPNTISTLHLMRCLKTSAPEFIQRHSPALERIEQDIERRQSVYRNIYSPSLTKLISATRIDQQSICAAGHYIELPGRKLFDGVAGVACSIRGHNPPSYVAELDQTGDLEDCRDELRERLHALTGLPHCVPAVSGASAVEHALKIALACQSPRDYVVALQGGFGGKTLFALTGTWKQSLKGGLAPLYPNVVFVDPFADDATAALEAVFTKLPIGVVQVELVQGVGGVRPIPPAVLDTIVQLRGCHDFLLLVDEVQTGMFRTGPFVRSMELGIRPDVLTIGKGTSDMMFPFAMSLHTECVQRRLEERGCSLPQMLTARYGYEIGYRTLLGTLRRADDEGLEERVRARGELFATLLAQQLQTCAGVRDVRCFGLLIGIELETEGRSLRGLKRLLPQLRLLAMLSHHSFPLVAGFCQYEPNVLKLTPPLSITQDEVRHACATISSVLQMSRRRLVASGMMQTLVRPRLNQLNRFFRRSATP
jgi:acetylornithine/succinyldiaminopimelate/putrescine aminotransferase